MHDSFRIPSLTRPAVGDLLDVVDQGEQLPLGIDLAQNYRGQITYLGNISENFDLTSISAG
jgi:hypothetical protein